MESKLFMRHKRKEAGPTSLDIRKRHGPKDIEVISLYSVMESVHPRK